MNILTLPISHNEILTYNNILNQKNIETSDFLCHKKNDNYNLENLINEDEKKFKKYLFIDKKHVKNIIQNGLNSIIKESELKYSKSRFYKIDEIKNIYNHEFKNREIHCYWCSYLAENIIPIPYHYSPTTKLFKVFGYFCSFNCAKAHILKESRHYDRSSQSLSLLNLLYKKITNHSIIEKPIKTAPPKESLIRYGGHLTIEEFRKNFNDNDIKISLKSVPYIYMNTVLETEYKYGNIV